MGVHISKRHLNAYVKDLCGRHFIYRNEDEKKNIKKTDEIDMALTLLKYIKEHPNCYLNFTFKEYDGTPEEIYINNKNKNILDQDNKEFILNKMYGEGIKINITKVLIKEIEVDEF